MYRDFEETKKLIKILEAKGKNIKKDEKELLEELKLLLAISGEAEQLNESLGMDPQKCPVCGK
ncbi:hypothetical protein ACV3R5_06115 [Clostridium perfringens]|uniref:hypothetical protein n=1 Tax=Clostridium perfringens TaxID=1502 RepID=UPI0024BC262C|nr:hypothetical protein [Clostridium perfringens]